MVRRSINTQNIAWFVDLINRGQVDMDPPYQRRSVWTKPYQRYFIDTIMRNYPSPPIFLDVKIDADGKTKYSVVDGKQRLESILAFIEGKIALPDDFGDARLDGKYFGELSTELKSRFWSYEIPVENLSDASLDEINQSFDRLNRNVLKLTPQELRHARFEGRFITLVTGLADDPFWDDNCISTRATIRRMRDIELVSDLFLLTMNGVKTTDKDSLDEAYAAYDDEVPNEEAIRRKFERIKDIIKALKLDVSSTRLRNFSDFYTLWSALLEFVDQRINFAETKAAIENFLAKLEELKDKRDEEVESSEKKFVDYLRAVASQPNSGKNRLVRKGIFMELIITE